MRRKREPVFSEETPARSFEQPQGDWVRAAHQFIGPARDGFEDDDTTQRFKAVEADWVSLARVTISADNLTLDEEDLEDDLPLSGEELDRDERALARADSAESTYDPALDDEREQVWQASRIVSGVTDLAAIKETSQGMPRVSLEEIIALRAATLASNNVETPSAELPTLVSEVVGGLDGDVPDDDSTPTLVLKRPVAPNVSSRFYLRSKRGPRAYMLHDVDDVDGDVATPRFRRPHSEWLEAARARYSSEDLRAIMDAADEEVARWASSSSKPVKASPVALDAARTGGRPREAPRDDRRMVWEAALQAAARRQEAYIMTPRAPAEIVSALPAERPAPRSDRGQRQKLLYWQLAAAGLGLLVLALLAALLAG